MSNEEQNGNFAKPMLANRIFKLRAWVRNELMVNVVRLQAVADKNAPFFGKSQIIQIQNY